MLARKMMMKALRGFVFTINDPVNQNFNGKLLVGGSPVVTWAFRGANGVTHTVIGSAPSVDFAALGLTQPVVCTLDVNNWALPYSISLSTQQLEGTIPDIGLFTNITQNLWASNQLTGNVHDISQNVKLITIQWYSNLLTGPLPDLSHLPFLKYFQVHNNRFTGSVPILDNNPDLLSVYVHDNQLTGPIPSLSNNPLLIDVRFYNNQLSGDVPDFSNNLKMTTFLAYLNNLTGWAGGTIPPNIGSVHLNNNALTEAAVDGLLAGFDAGGRTSADGSCSLYMSTGTNAPPSPAGLVSKANLIAKGWTVSTN